MTYNFNMDTINYIQVNQPYKYLMFLNNLTINLNTVMIIDSRITDEG
jgi:hypothetical protein